MTTPQLPPGWEWKRLGDICDQIRGVSYKPDESSGSPQKGYIPLYRAHNIQESGLNENELIYVDSKRISTQQYIKSGDIIICASSGSKDLVGKSAQADEDSQFSFGAFCKVVRPKGVDKKYLGFFFKSNEYRQSISNVSVGTNINNIRNEDIDSLLVPLPPLPEQRRIAVIIDAQLAAVEKAQQAAEEQERAANDLVQIYLCEVFSHNTESNTPLIEIGKLCENKITNLSHTASGYIDYIDISSIDNISKRITETQTLLASEAPSRAKQILKANDILVSNVRPNLNAVAINDISSNNIVVGSTGYCILRCKSNLNYKYLFYFCQSKNFIDRLSNLAKGSSYPAVTNVDVLTGKIPLPLIDEQYKIVSNLENKIRNVTKLKTVFNEQQEWINALPASILRKAFRGEL
jgi:type I restriction enzyme S subunit